MTLREFYLRYVAVRKCGGCRKILEYEYSDSAFCPDCDLAWRAAKTETCENCKQSAVECTCMPKGLSSSGALCLRKLIFYSTKKNREVQNRAIYFLKKNKNRRIASFFAKELAPLAKAELRVLTDAPEDNTVIVSVPRGIGARAEYGFDQSELVCGALSEHMGIPYFPAIKRRIGGREQKHLDSKKRFRNVRSLFKLRNKYDLSGKYVLLFDDVVTTGASMAACVAILKKAGALGVICLCIAED